MVRTGRCERAVAAAVFSRSVLHRAPLRRSHRWRCRTIGRRERTKSARITNSTRTLTCCSSRPAAIGRTERPVVASVCALHATLVYSGAVAKVVHLSVSRNSGVRTHIAVGSRGKRRVRAPASGNRTHVAPLHGLTEIRLLMLERGRARHSAACRSKETLRTAIADGRRGRSTPARR